jgi:flagellar hook-length control protein FliK
MGMTINSAGAALKGTPRADAASGDGTSSNSEAAAVSAFSATDAGSLPGVESDEMDLAAAAEADSTGNAGPAAGVHAAKTESDIHGEANPNELSISGLMQHPAAVDANASSGKAATISHTNSASVPATPETQFAAANHGNIVSGVRGQLLPNGGSMQIRLDPAELGVLQVSVKMENGVLSASFQTSSDEATKLLSHSLGQLKQTLESQGLSVDRLHVQQAPRNDTAGNQTGSDDSSQQQSQAQERDQQQDQQRREMLRRMWAQVAGGDPLDLVA